MRKHRWRRQELINVLKKVEKQHGFAGTWRLERVKRPGYVKIRYALKREYSSLRRAKEIAGVRTWPIWTQEHVKEEILARARRGKEVSWEGLHGQDRRLWHGARRAYGSWKKAVLASASELDTLFGSEWRKPKSRREPRSRRNSGNLPSWSREKVILRIQELHRSGDDLRGMKRRLGGLYRAARRWVGGWRAALKDAEVPIPLLVRIPSPWTRDRILEVLRDEWRRGRDLRRDWIRKRISGLVRRASFEFGRWRNTLQAAGITCPNRRTRKWTPDTILATLRGMWALGDDLGSTHVLRECGGLYSAGIREFGSWRKALEAVGFPWEGRCSRNRGS